VRPFLSALSIVLLGGCNGDPYSTRYTTREPVVKDLLGVYTPDAATLSALQGKDSGPHRIELRDGGDLILSNVPRGTLWGVSQPAFDSGRGSWSISRQQDWWGIDIHLREINGRPVNLYTYFHLRNEKPPYLIHVTLGDPDSGDAHVFERS
jgi:hypothetical protein